MTLYVWFLKVNIILTIVHIYDRFLKKKDVLARVVLESQNVFTKRKNIFISYIYIYQLALIRFTIMFYYS